MISSVRKCFLPSMFVISISVVLVETFSMDEFMGLVKIQREKDARRHEEFVFQGLPGREYKGYSSDRHGRKFKTCNVRNETAGVVEEEIHRCYLQPNQHDVGCFYTYTYDTKTAKQGCYDVRAEDNSCSEKCNVNANKYSTPPGVPHSELTTAFCCCTTNNCNEANEMDLQEAHETFLDSEKEKDEHHHHRRRELRPTSSHHGKKFKKFFDLFHRRF